MPAVFSNWSECRQWFAHARSPDRGRPIKTGWRMFKGEDNAFLGEDNAFFITAHSYRVCTFNSDDTVTFDITDQTLPNICHTISSTLSSVVPYLICRVGTGRYVVNHVGALVMPLNGERWYTAFTKQAYDLFPGVTFDNKSMACINPRPKATKETEHTENRRIWLHTLRRFKRGLAVRGKLGVFTAIHTAMAAEKFPALRVDTLSDSFVEFLYNCMRNDEYPDEVLRGLGFTRYGLWRPTGNLDKLAVEQASSTLSSLSFRLRQRFGVWDNA